MSKNKIADFAMAADKQAYISESSYLSDCRTYIKNRFNELKTAAATLENAMQTVKAAAYNEHLEYKTGANMADSAVVQQELWQNHIHLEDIKQEQTVLQRLYQEPYFACLDFRFEGEDEAERFRLGINSLFDEDNYRQWIIDWRSPIAGLYYDGTIGPAEYAVAYDKVRGELLGKQQILIRNGEIKAIYERSNLLHDELLEWVLSQPSSAHLEQIVATIQSEQNELIRAEQRQNLLVYGVAGSGKSSIALHRVSYLFYLHPEYTAQNFLFISPNPQFAEYISELLPNLNDSNIGTSTLKDLYRSILFNAESNLSRFNYLKVTAAEKAAVASFAFADCLQTFLSKLADNNFLPHDLQLDDLNFPAASLADLYQREYRSLPLWRRTEAICGYLRETVNSKAFEYHAEAIADELWKMQKFTDLRTVLTAFYQSEAFAAYLHKLTQTERWCLENKVLRSTTKLDEIDELVLAYIQIVLANDYDTETVKHLLIDEAQDLTALEHVLLNELFTCDKTVCADFNQAIFWPAGADFAEEVKTFYASRRKLLFKELTAAYRSTYEITEFSALLLNNPKIQAVNRHGKAVSIEYLRTPFVAAEACTETFASPPKVESPDLITTTFKDVRLKLLNYCTEWENSSRKQSKRIALILPSEAAVTKYGTLIGAEATLSPYYVDWQVKPKQSFLSTVAADLDLPANTNSEKLTVELHTPESVKGMEFDVVMVILAGAECYSTETDRLRLYVACTRALHELYLIMLQPSPFLLQASLTV